MNWTLLIFGFLLGVVITLVVVYIWFVRKKTNIQPSNRNINFLQNLQQILIWIRILWYPGLFILFTIYVIWHYPECKEFTFFENFKGDNVIFLLYLLLLLIPIFSKVVISGITIELWEGMVSKYVADKASNPNDIASVEKLKEEYNKKDYNET